MLIVSVGTGTSPKANEDLAPGDMNLIYNATSIPSALMYAALNEQDMLCRVFGDCRHGDPLDREVGDLRGARGPVEPKLFTYVRYNAELTDGVAGRARARPHPAALGAGARLDPAHGRAAGGRRRGGRAGRAGALRGVPGAPLVTGMSAALREVWTAQRKWSAVADQAGDRLSAWRLVDLALLVLGALLGVLAAQASLLVERLQIWTTLAGAVVLIGAAVVQRVALRPVGVERQAAARAVSEALKAETFRYLAGVAPYAGEDRDAVLASARPRIEAQAGTGLDERSRRAVPDGKPPPPVTDVDSYLAERAIGQCSWHRKRIATYERRARRAQRGAGGHGGCGAAGRGHRRGGAAGRDHAPGQRGLGRAGHDGRRGVRGAPVGHPGGQDRLRLRPHGAAAHPADRRPGPAAATPERDAEFVVRVEQVLARQNDSWISLITS